MDSKNVLPIFLFNNSAKYIQLLVTLLHFMNNSNVSVSYRFMMKLRESHIKHEVNHDLWLNRYAELEFYKLFRMKKETFHRLLRVIVDNDIHCLITKKYRGGRYPIVPEKSLLIFLWYMSKQDSLLAIADRFGIVASTVMQIVNAMLYIIVLRMKQKYIIWPNSQEEFDYIEEGFRKYPGVIGCIDGSHINVKVPSQQHDSYVDRYQQHSINLMAVCNADKVFTYTFIGFPGSAHDARVFSNSMLVQNIERYSANRYFRDVQRYHLLGDSAFPIREWLMTPYKQYHILNPTQRYHNYCLSSERVCIENAFGILKGRWQRLFFINTYNMCKAIEITTAGCILHNFCILNADEWTEEIVRVYDVEAEFIDDQRHLQQAGIEKRNRIARQLHEYNNP